MQPKPHPDPNGVDASAIVRVDEYHPPVRRASRYFGLLASGALLASDKKLTVGEISVQPNVGSHLTMTKEEFELAYEACDPVIESTITIAPDFDMKVFTTHRKRTPCK